MTTIAWDGKTLACDSQATCNDVVMSSTTKKIFKNVGPYAAVAGAGSQGQVVEWISWIKSGKNGDAPETKVTMLCIKPNGRGVVIFTGQSQEEITLTKNSAEGSGMDIAIGAMDAGKSAIEAVKIAIKRDIHSGGKVQSYTVRTV